MPDLINGLTCEAAGGVFGPEALLALELEVEVPASSSTVRYLAFGYVAPGENQSSALPDEVVGKEAANAAWLYSSSCLSQSAAPHHLLIYLQLLRPEWEPESLRWHRYRHLALRQSHSRQTHPNRPKTRRGLYHEQAWLRTGANRLVDCNYNRGQSCKVTGAKSLYMVLVQCKL